MGAECELTGFQVRRGMLGSCICIESTECSSQMYIQCDWLVFGDFATVYCFDCCISCPPLSTRTIFFCIAFGFSADL